ncbi:hypothetical protein Tco_0491846 [Tanacetum coccineum]
MVVPAVAANFNQANSGLCDLRWSANQIRSSRFSSIFRILMQIVKNTFNREEITSSKQSKQFQPAVTNPKEDLKAEVVQPPLVQIQSRNPNPEPTVAPKLLLSVPESINSISNHEEMMKGRKRKKLTIKSEIL